MIEGSGLIGLKMGNESVHKMHDLLDADLGYVLPVREAAWVQRAVGPGTRLSYAAFAAVDGRLVLARCWRGEATATAGRWCWSRRVTTQSGQR